MKTEVRFVLVRPRNPMNIGAVARAMANFGFKRLVVVDPYEPIWKETRSAVGAASVIKSAKRVSKLSQAIKGCQWVIGTSAGQQRAKDRRWMSVDEIKPLLSFGKGAKKSMALVFGSEKSGLKNDDLNFCHRILKLPTVEACPSMNLSQAVAVTAYVTAQAMRKKTVSSNGVGPSLSTEVMERLVHQGTKACETSGLFKAWDTAGREKRLRQAFYQWNLNTKDVAMLHSLFRWITTRAGGRS